MENKVREPIGLFIGYLFLFVCCFFLLFHRLSITFFSFIHVTIYFCRADQFRYKNCLPMHLRRQLILVNCLLQILEVVFWIGVFASESFILIKGPHCGLHYSSEVDNYCTILGIYATRRNTFFAEFQVLLFLQIDA